MKTLSYRNNRKRAGKYIRERKDFETLIKRKAYTEPERGGIILKTPPPEIPDLDNFFNQFNVINEKSHRDFFIDTCALDIRVLYNPSNKIKNSAFDLYQNLLDYIPNLPEKWNTFMEQLHIGYERCAAVYEKLFQRENVFILSGVLEELKNELRILRRESKKSPCCKFSKKYLAPFYQLCESAARNQERTDYLEKDDLTKLIYGRIPDRTVRGELSSTDRMLISASIAKALRNGNCKTILTTDSGIFHALRSLRDNPSQSEDFDGSLAGFPRTVSVELRGFYLDLESKKYYSSRSFFSISPFQTESLDKRVILTN